MSTKAPAIFNTIRNVVNELGWPDEHANTLCDRVGEDFLDAVRDQQSEYRDDSPPPRRLGHTEVEAAVRWCPLVREVTPVGKGAKDAAIGNRYIDKNGSEYANPAGCLCIGSVCMFWRWDDATRGHCGIAGPLVFQPIGEPRRLVNRTPLERPTASERVDLDDDEAAR
jgi:hypothetical protein